MGWLESQIEQRARLDTELTERAYAELAASVSGPEFAPRFSADDPAQSDAAIRACLKYLRVTPGSVPVGVQDIEDQIDWLCRPSGTMRRTVRLDPGWQKSSFGAMLGCLEDGTAVALLPRGTSGYCYLEPGTDRKVKVTPEVAASLRREAVLFYKPLPPKKLSVRDLFSFIMRVFDRSDYLLVLIAASVSMLIGLVPAWANNVAFGTVVPSGRANLVLPVGALLLGAVVSATLIGACRNLVMSRVSVKLNVVTEAATFARVLTLPASFFKEYSSGNLASRVATVTDLVTNLASLMLGSGLTALLSLVYVFQIGVYAPALALPALAVALVQAALAIISTVAAVSYERRMMEANAKLSGTVTALLNGIQKIKLAGAEDRAFAKWASGYAKYAKAAYNQPALISGLPAFVSFAGLIGTIVIYYLAGTTHVSVADYMSFNAAFGQVSGAMMSFASMAAQLARIHPMFNLVAPILEATPELAEDKPSVESLNGAVEVSGVAFRYRPEAPYVLNNLSFKVHPGEYVALVGKSGCGKSTVLRLLLGFEKPERGAVFFGPYDVQKVELGSLRRNIGVVMQDGKLFLGDIFSNIVVSAPNATLDDAWEAAEMASIADDIRKMPMGMQTIISEGGGGVSGGQRQRLMIARAICGKRRILMFDEATSALDNVTQKNVTEALATLNCTRIVVAHRLSTVRHCDRILVLDGGTIAEEGTYEELIAKNGLFAELVARQRLDEES